MYRKPNAIDQKRQAVEQLRAIARMSWRLSDGLEDDDSGVIDGDILYMAVAVVVSVMARDVAKPDGKPEAIAPVAEAIGTIFRFAAENSEYRSNDLNELDSDQREGLKNCAAMAEIAARLCREAAAGRRTCPLPFLIGTDQSSLNRRQVETLSGKEPEG